MNWSMAFTPHEQQAMRCRKDAKQFSKYSSQSTKYYLIERNSTVLCTFQKVVEGQYI